jgi:hypothetical protein
VIQGDSGFARFGKLCVKIFLDTQEGTVPKHWKLLLLIPFYLMLLGADDSGCEEEGLDAEVPLVTASSDTRTLRKLIEIGSLRSQPMNLPDGSLFDFAFVANAQFYELLDRSNYFVLPFRQGTIRSRALTPVDSDLLGDWMASRSSRAYNTSYDAECMLETAQVMFEGEIQSYELKSSSGFSFGFGDLISIGSGGFSPSLDVNVASSELNLSIRAVDRWEEVIVASAQGDATRSKTDLNLGINFAGFSLGPRHYYESPLADVTRNALTRAVNHVVGQLDEEPWFTRVLEDQDTHLVIGAGSRAGLKKGDMVEVYNETHYWTGEPCRSQYRGGAPSLEPVAKGRIVQLGPMIGLVEVVEQGFDNPTIGAKVIVTQFAEE